jgi:hypothetical protein
MNDVDPRVGSLMKCYRILSFLDRHLRNWLVDSGTGRITSR